MRKIINNQKRITDLNRLAERLKPYVGHSIINANYRPRGFFNVIPNAENPFLECWSILYHPRSNHARPFGSLLVSSMESNPTLYWARSVGDSSVYNSLHRKNAKMSDINQIIVNNTAKLTGDVNNAGATTLLRCMLPNVLVIRLDTKLYAIFANSSFNFDSSDISREVNKFISNHKKDEDYVFLGEVTKGKTIAYTHFDYGMVYKYDGVSYVSGVTYDEDNGRYDNYLITVNGGEITDKLIKSVDL